MRFVRLRILWWRWKYRNAPRPNVSHLWFKPEIPGIAETMDKIARSREWEV